MRKPLANATTVPLVVMLAGGEGKRFSPLVTNKTLFPFFGKPLLVHQIEQLQRVGVTELLVATNSENHQLVSELKLSGLNISAKRQPKPLGMADAILQLKEEINNQPIIVINSVDVVADKLFQDLLEKIGHTSAAGIITGIKLDQYFPGGYIQLEHGLVKGIIEKPKPGEEPSELVNLVFHYIKQPQQFFDKINAIIQDNDDAYEQALTELMSSQPFEALAYDGFWHKLKYPHFVLDVMDIFLNNYLVSKIEDSAKISKMATLEGEIYLGEGVVIEAGAVIKGPTYIGAGSVVGNGSLVRQSVVENNAIVGFGCEVARSYVGPGCMLHHNFIGDSVLESSVNPSYGTAMTNLRLDGQPVALKTVGGKINTGRDKLGAILAKDVFAGANCTFMPGVTVGEAAQVYPGVVVYDAVDKQAVVKK